MTIRIVVADNQQLYRHCLISLLAGEPDFAMVGEVGDEAELVPVVAKSNPDLVFLGARLVRTRLLAATRDLVATCPTVKIICIADAVEWQLMRDIVRAGASGFLSQAAAATELVLAVRTVTQGPQRYFSRDAMAAVTNAVLESDSALPHAPTLTAREQEVLQMIGEGCSTAEIARRLELTGPTVRSYRSKIMGKLDLHNAADLTRYAIGNGYCRTAPA